MNDRQVAVVTGASRGIGRAIALQLARDGYDIVGISRSLKSNSGKKNLEDLSTQIEAEGADFLPQLADIAEIEKHDAHVGVIIKRFGRIDLLVNNAGVAPLKRMDILETTPESYDRLMSINLRGPFFFTQKVTSVMIDMIGKVPDYSPKIIFITSVSAEVSSTNRAEYCISKAGLSMAARVFADRLAGPGIGVFEIRPGIVLTDMTKPVKEKYDKMIAEGMIPMNRWGKPEDIASAVAAIAAGNFDYGTGAVIELSGGMNIRSL